MLHTVTFWVFGGILSVALIACGGQETTAQTKHPEQKVLVSSSVATPAQMFVTASAQQGIVAQGGWVRAGRTAGGMTAGYVTLVNHTDQEDQLISLSTPVATDLEVHQMTVENGVMKMRPKTDISIAPGNSIQLAPGGDHLMFINLTENIEEGDIIPVTLEFTHAGVITLTLPAQSSSQK